MKLTMKVEQFRTTAAEPLVNGWTRPEGEAKEVNFGHRGSRGLTICLLYILLL